MRVLLIYPHEVEPVGHYMANLQTTMPLGLGYLAAVLERAGHEVEVLDFQIKGVTLELLAGKLRNRHFDMCGISTSTPFSRIAYIIAETAKKNSPESAIVLGGPHTVAVGKVVLEECPASDYAVYREGEVTILELLDAIAGKRRPESVDGIGFRKGDDIFLTRRREFIKDIDSIPLPAYHHFELRKYRPLVAQFRRLPWASIISSRGCPYHCIYCNEMVWGHTCRIRSAANVMEEILLLKNRYGVREVSFADDTFTVSRRRTEELCETLIEAGNPVIWKCSTRVDRVDYELLKLLKKAGCYSVGYGVESGSQKILDIIKKGIAKEQIRKAFSDSKRAGLETRAYFMLNLPHDDVETTEETIGFSRELDADYLDFEFAHPYPGTAFRRLIESDERYTIVKDKWNDPRAQVGNHIIFLQPGLSEEALRKYLKRAFVGYYLRPKQIFRHMRSLFSPGRSLATIKAAWNILHVRAAD